MSKSLNILVVEDSASDAKLVIRQIEQAGYEVHWRRVETAADLKRALPEEGWKAVLSDYAMPDFTGTDALSIVQASGRDLPFIFVSGLMGEDVAVQAMKAGAHDYVVKGKLKRLVPAIERELREVEERRQRRAAEQALRENEARYRLLADNTLDVIWTMNMELEFTYVNRAINELTGHSADEWIGSRLPDHCDEDHFAELGKLIQRELAKGPEKQGIVFETEMLRKDGSPIPLEIHAKIIFDDKGAPITIQGTTRNITERRRAEERDRHLKGVLGSIRDVNQIIVRAKERQPLIEAAAGSLGSTRGFRGAWIVLTDRLPGELQSAQAGFPDDAFRGLTAWVEAGHIPPCCERARDGNCVVTVTDPAQACEDCPLARVYHGAAGMGVCLAHGGRMFGCMGVSVPPEFANDEQEQSLLSEIAGDIAFALWSIETETQRETLARKYAAVLSATSDAVLAVDPDGRITVFNSGAEKLFGCTADDALGTPIARFCPEDRLAEQAEKMRRVRDTGTVPRYETERLTADGRRIPVEITLGLNTDDRGRRRAINAILRDITERKRMEEALQESLQRLSFALQGGELGMWDWNPQDGTVVYSDHWAQMLGYRPDEVEPTVEFFKQHVHPEDLAAVLDRLTGHVEGRLPVYESEHRLRTRSGRFLWGMNRGKIVERDKNGSPVRVTGIIADITERKQAEEALRASQELFRTFMANNPAAAWIADRHGVITYASPGYSKMFSVGDPTGQSVFDIYPEPIAREYVTNNERVLAADRVEEIVESGLRADGSPGSFLVFKFPVRAEDGSLHIGGTAIDITERKRAEEAEREQRDFSESLIETAQTIILVLDIQGRIVRFNPFMEQLVGYELDEVKGMDWFKTFLTPELGLTIKPLFQKTLADVDTSGNVNPIIAKDGRAILVEWHNKTLKDKDGRTVGILAIGQDITERKQAEEALRESEEHHRSTLDGLSAHIAVIDERGEIILTNRAYRDFGERNGIKPDAVSEGTNYLAVCDTASGEHSEEAGPFADGIRKVLSGKLPSFDLEYPCHSPDEKRWFIGRVTPINGEGPRRVVIAHEHITRRKLAEEALRKSEERFLLAMKASNDGLFDWNLETNEIYYSPGWKKMLGYEDHELPNDFSIWENTTDPEDMKKSWELQQKLITKQIDRFVIEFKMKHKAGHWVDILVRAEAIFNDSGKAVRIVGTHTDITERKRSEAVLLASETRYKSAEKMGHVGNWEYDLTTGLFWGSDEAKRIYGFDPNQENFSAEAVETCIPERDRVHQALLDLIEKGTEYNLEFQIFPVNSQQPKTIVSLAEIQKDEKGLPVSVVGVVQDITERKQAEAEREKLQAQLIQSQKMEAVGQLAGGIAHDFNNILVPIIGYAELGMMGLSPNDKLYAKLQHIHRAAERAAALTQQILAFSRKQVLEMKPLNLNEVVTNFEKMLRRLIGEDITLKAVLSPSLALVQADPAQIEQILMNLAINARDAMPWGGKLTIETDNLFLDEPYAHTHIGVQPGPYVMLAVSDTGIGMDAKTKEHIFEPFFTTKPQGAGTGLGLATVFGIVKQHKGYIWVYSEPGQGTTFKVYLPQADRTEPDIATPAQPDSLYGTETILLVEDEAMVRKLACETLTAHGYTVLEAQSPADALRLTANYQDTINLLLTDVIMPEMNGRQLYEKVAAIRPEISVLYMSGYTDNVIVHHGVLYQDVNFLQKPFTVHRLTQKVREALR